LLYYDITIADGITTVNIKMEDGTMSKTEAYLRVNECAEKYPMSNAWWRRAILERRISVVRIGRAVLVPQSEIDRILNEGFEPRIDTGRDTK